MEISYCNNVNGVNLYWLVYFSDSKEYQLKPLVNWNGHDKIAG